MSGDLQASTPTEIRKRGSEGLKVVWADGHVSQYGARYLRGRCPCAMCVDENSGRRRIGEPDLPAEVALAGAELVGSYAVQLAFGDGHRTGLYSFSYLRALCPCALCAGGDVGDGSALP